MLSDARQYSRLFQLNETKQLTQIIHRESSNPSTRRLVVSNLSEPHQLSKCARHGGPQKILPTPGEQECIQTQRDSQKRRGCKKSTIHCAPRSPKPASQHSRDDRGRHTNCLLEAN